MSESFQYNTEPEEAVLIKKKSRELFNKMNNSKRKIIEKKIQRLQDMQYIFDKNHDELIEHIDKFQENEFVKKLIGNDELSRIEILQKTLRYLFNYLSSAVALYDHTTKFMGEYEGTEFDTKATEWVNSNIPVGINSSIRGLRRYIVHIALPNSFLRYESPNIYDPSCKKTILLNLCDSINSEQCSNFSWKKDALDYITANYSLDSVDVKKFCDDYYNIICVYYKWFFAELKEYHKDDYEEYERLKTQYDTYYEKYSNYINEHNLTQESKE